MSKKLGNKSVSSSLDSVKNISAAAILLVSLVGYYKFSEVHAVIRILAILVGVGVSIFIFYQSEKGKSWFKYLSSAKKEVKQVIWPTRQETVQMTLIVFVAVIVMSIFLWLVDMFFLWAVKLLTVQGG
jgi:preprotein translocase subunit SecE